MKRVHLLQHDFGKRNLNRVDVFSSESKAKTHLRAIVVNDVPNSWTLQAISDAADKAVSDGHYSYRNGGTVILYGTGVN